MGVLDGKTAIITGGGRAVLSDGGCGSIGYGIATAYAKEGANLVITGRNVKKLDDAKEELERLYGTKVLPVAATEWAKDGINVNIICPLAWTAQLEQFKNAYPDAFEKNVHTPPMGHFADAEKEIGRVCVPLASEDFKYMSGETITLEGGLGQRP